MPARVWDSGLVKRSSLFGLLLAALACAGLILAPVATAAAVPIEMAAAQSEAAAVDMPEDMPCCPQTQKAPDCAKICPFMAVCAGMAFPIATIAAVSVPATRFAVLAPHDDAKLSGLAQGPPAKPPKA
jgi:hypothetical protein